MADSTVMMALGDYLFSVSSAAYQELERTNEWRWPTVERIGAAPARQYVGPGDDIIRMSGTIYPHFVAQRRGLDQLPLMRQEASKGEPLTLVDGTGKVWGNFCVLSIREGQKAFFSDGAPRCIEFTIEVGAYGRYNPMVGSTATTAAGNERVERAPIQSQVDALKKLVS